jgi:hypothetical protein
MARYYRFPGRYYRGPLRYYCSIEQYYRTPQNCSTWEPSFCKDTDKRTVLQRSKGKVVQRNRRVRVDSTLTFPTWTPS